MLDPLLRNEILLEIALSLGGANQLTTLLQRSLPVFMSKLNCVIASVVQNHPDQTETVMIIPRIFQRSSVYQEVVAEMTRQAKETGDAAPWRVVRDGVLYYGFLLQGFGLLILGRSQSLDEMLLRELGSVVALLARECVGCLDYARRIASEALLDDRRQQLHRLTECLAHLSGDYLSNIHQLMIVASELLKADSVVYYRLEHGLAVARGQWGILHSAQRVFRPSEQRCRAVFEGRERRQYFPAAEKSPCGSSHCLSNGIFQGSRCLGALCLCFLAPHRLSEDDQSLIALISQGLEREEVTHSAYEKLSGQLRCEIGLSHFASSLISDPKDIDPLPVALQHLLDATEAGRVYLFENFSDPVEGLCCRQTHEVCAWGVEAQLGNPLLQCIPYYAVPYFHQELAQRKTINRIVTGLPPAEYQILTLQKILSVLLIPVFVQGEWRGFMGFDDVRQARDWSEQEIRLLQTAVDIYQLYVSRQDQDRAVRASEARHRSLYRLMRLLCDNAPDMIWAKDVERNYLFANQALCTQLLMTVDPNEPVGKSDLFFGEREARQHSDQPQWLTFGATCRESDAAVMRDGKSRRLEESGYVRGEWLVLDVIKSPLWDETGQMIGTVGCARNITQARQLQKEQEAAEQQLRESENLLNLIIEAIPNPVFYKNTEGRYERCNQAYADFLGISKQRLIGATVYDLFPHDLAEIYDRADRLLHQTYGQQIYEAQLTHADQSRHDVVFYKSMIINVDGTAHGIVGTIVDITQHKQSEVQLRRLAEMDALTQTYNRAYFYTVIEQEFDRARRYHRRLSLIMLDLDHFKTINDTYGHDVGDQVLQGTAALMKSLIRKHDILVRWGGEEFVILCVETPFGEAYSLSERLLEALRQQVFPVVGQVTASFGIVEYREDDESTHALFKRLDMALYAAKANGRNRIECIV